RAAGEVRDGESVLRDHHADRREGLRAARVPRGGHRGPVGRPRPHGHLGGRLLLPILPEGRLPRDRARRRTLVVSAVAIVAAYLIGAVPIGYLVGRVFGVADIRRHGSG